MTGLAGDALVRELARRFVTVVDRVQLGRHRFEILRPRCAEDLISEEDFARDERLPYWADVWPSSLILGERILDEDGRGRRLLELGCGVGVVAVAAMRAGYDVLATDYYEDALRFTRANAWRAFGTEPATRMVDWRAVPDGLGVFDRIVASDVLYERDYASLIASAIARTLSPDGDALIADPGRAGAGQLSRYGEGVGLCVRATESRMFQAGDARQRITIYSLRWARGGGASRVHAAR